MTCEALREKAVGNGAEDAAADRMAAEPAERTEVSVSDCGTVREALRQASGRRRKIVVFGSLSILKEVYEAAAPGYLD